MANIIFAVACLCVLLQKSAGTSLTDFFHFRQVADEEKNGIHEVNTDFPPSTEETTTAESPPGEGDYCKPYPDPVEHAEYVKPYNKPNVSVTCGEFLDCKSGGIFYKPFENVRPNERCIWTVFVPNARAYEVTLQYYGYTPTANNDDGHGLIISGFQGGLAPSHFIPTTTEATTVTNTSLLFVTFLSGPNPNNQSGFILQFKTIFEGPINRVANTTSLHYLIGNEHWYLNHGSTKRYELSSFVFLPKDNLYRPSVENRIFYMLNGLSNCATEQLKVYYLSSTCVGAHKWEYQGRLCQSSGTIHHLQNTEPILIIYEGTTVERLTGFHFIYTTSCIQNEEGEGEEQQLLLR